jgi:hypothetical protein
MCGRVHPCDTLLYRLPQPCKPMPSALAVRIEAEDAMVGPRPLTRHRPLTAADQSHIGHRLTKASDGRVVTAASAQALSATQW